MQEKSDFSHFFMCDVSPFRLCLMSAFAQKFGCFAINGALRAHRFTIGYKSWDYVGTMLGQCWDFLARIQCGDKRTKNIDNEES